MTSDATTHALADENCSFRAISLARPIQCFSMGSNQLWQGIRPFPAFAHVVVIESPDLSYLRQNLLPTLHPGMRRRRPCARSQQEQWSHSVEVAREIFGIEDSVIRENGAPILFVAMDCHQDARRRGLDSKEIRGASFATPESPDANRLSPYCTVTSVPTGISEKNLRAASSGNLMQPCDAG